MKKTSETKSNDEHRRRLGLLVGQVSEVVANMYTTAS